MGLNVPPRVRLGSIPTPCEPASDLGALLEIDQLWIKRDDLLGHSWGGNKVRPIEFLLGDALHQRADAVVLCGGPTSNFAALMAAACAQYGIQVHQVSYGNQPDRLPAAMAIGARSGTTFHFTGSPDRMSMEPAAQTLADRLQAMGGTPYRLPRGGATAVGSLGYAHAAAELAEQLTRSGLSSATVVVPVGSGGTIAGLIAGWTYMLDSATTPFDIDLIGVSVSRAPEDLQAEIAGIARATAERCGYDGARRTNAACRWRLADGRGIGFGVSDATERALIDRIELRTRFLVDPTYNSKALRWLRDSSARLHEPVVYWHTGGSLGVVDRIFNRGDATASQPTETTFQ